MPVRSTSQPPQHTEKLPLYFDDLDAYGMVHHARFAVLLDRAFSAYFSGLGLHLGHEDGSLMVRELTLTFDRPIRATPAVDVNLRVESVGTTSAVFLFEFRTGQDVHAHGRRVVVKVDPVNGTSVPWSGQFRQKLAAAAVRGDSACP